VKKTRKEGMMKAPEVIEAASGKWRFKLGIAIFILAFALWLLVPVAALMQVGASTIAALTSTVFIANKVLLLLVVAIMGKPGFQQLKRRSLGYAAALAPSGEAGPLRHRIGLVMFFTPLISSFVEPYVDAIAPDLRPDSWLLQLVGDLMLIGSFFVLGRNFWEKATALFVRTARVVDAPPATAT
jgi:hypothetical protein